MGWVTLREAARVEGISEKTARVWAKQGRWPTRRVAFRGGQRIEVDLPEAHSIGDDGGGLVDVLKLRVQDLSEQLAARTREISELHQLLAGLAPGVDRRWWAFWKR